MTRVRLGSKVVLTAILTYYAVLLTLLALNIASFNASPSDFSIAGYGWGTPSNPLNAYPGSSKVSYYVSLTYLGSADVTRIYAELYLPKFMKTFSENSSVIYLSRSVTLSKYGIVDLIFPNIVIADNALEGTYYGKLRLTYITVNGVESSQELNVPIVISSIPKRSLDVIDISWRTVSGVRRSALPGLRNVDLVMYLRVMNDVQISNVYSIVEFPKGFLSGGLTNATTVVESRLTQGDLMELRFRNINVSSELQEGVYNATLIIEYQLDLYGLSRSVVESFEINLSVSTEGMESLEFVSAIWGVNNPVPAYPGMSDASITVSIINIGDNDVYGMRGILKLPKGFRSSYGDELVNFTLANRLPPGTPVNIVINGISIDPTVRPDLYKFTLYLDYLKDVDGSVIDVKQVFNFSLPISSYDTPISVLSTRWVNGDSYGIVVPGFRGARLEVTLANWDKFPVELMGTSIILPNGFQLIDMSGSCFNGIPAYSTCALDISINIGDDVEPDEYPAQIILNYLVKVDNAAVINRSTVVTALRVWDPSIFGAKLLPTLVMWGVEGRPDIALPGARLLPLTLRLTNIGKDAAASVVTTLKLPNVMRLTYPEERGLCDRVERGSSCQITYYVDIDPYANAGVYNATIEINYITYFSNVNISKREVFNISISIESPPRELALKVVSAGWLNNWPTYPGDKNVTLVVRIANLGPYRISSVILKMTLPDGIICDESSNNTCEAYYAGPVPPFQQFNVSFSVSVEPSVNPGIYVGKLMLDYIADTGGYGRRLIETQEVRIPVTSADDAIEVVGIYWVNTTVSSGDVGLLRIVLRNNKVPHLSGLTVDVLLPEGFTALPNNSSSISIPYYPQYLVRAQGVYGIPLQISPSSSVLLGDVIFIDVPIRVLDGVEPGAYNFSFTINFINHWNTLQQIKKEGSIYVTSKMRIIHVEPVDPLVIAGEAISNVEFKLMNLGEVPIYNLIVVAYTPSPGLSIYNPVSFIDKVDGRNYSVIRLGVTANPEVIEGPYPIVFAIAFQDYLGRFHTINMSSTVIVRGIIKIELTSFTITSGNLTAGMPFTVSAVIINEGKMALRHATALLESDVLLPSKPYYIGNIDPESQIPISLEAQVRPDVTPGSYNAKLKITFYDMFYNLHTYEKSFVINVVENVTTTLTAGPPPVVLPSGTPIVIASIISAAVITIVLLQWYRRKVGRRV